MVDDTDTVRVGGLTLHECARLISAVKAEHGDDTPLSECIHGRYVEADREDLVAINDAARKWGRVAFDTTLWGAHRKLDDAI